MRVCLEDDATSRVRTDGCRETSEATGAATGHSGRRLVGRCAPGRRGAVAGRRRHQQPRRRQSCGRCSWAQPGPGLSTDCHVSRKSGHRVARSDEAWAEEGRPPAAVRRRATDRAGHQRHLHEPRAANDGQAAARSAQGLHGCGSDAAVAHGNPGSRVGALTQRDGEGKRRLAGRAPALRAGSPGTASAVTARYRSDRPHQGGHPTR